MHYSHLEVRKVMEMLMKTTTLTKTIITMMVPSAKLRHHREREGERLPLRLLRPCPLPLDGERFSPPVLGHNGSRRGERPFEIGSLLCLSIFQYYFLAERNFLNSQRFLNPIVQKF